VTDEIERQLYDAWQDAESERKAALDAANAEARRRPGWAIEITSGTDRAIKQLNLADEKAGLAKLKWYDYVSSRQG